MNRPFRITLIAFLACSGFVPSAGMLAQDNADALYRKAYGFILKESWAEAEESFGQFLGKFGDSHWADDADFWICYAKDKGRLPAEASFECYREFLRKWPGSEWCDDARRNLVVLSKRLARDGKPEYLVKAESLVDESEHGGTPEDEVVYMLASLGELGDPRSLKVLFRYLDETKDERLRARLVLLLEDIDSPDATRKLIDMVRNDSSLEVRENAVHTLMSKEDQAGKDLLMEVAKSEKYPLNLRTEVISSLYEMPGQATAELLRDLALSGGHEEIVDHALSALADMEDETATKALFEIFNKSQSNHMREKVLSALSQTEGPEALAFLTRLALDGKDPDLSEMAVHAIEGFDETKALAALDHILSSSADWRTKVAAAYTLGDFESKESLAILKKLLKTEPNLQIRLAAVSALGNTNSPEAVPILTDLILKDPEPAVRKEAIDALGDLDDVPSAREALLKILEARIEKE